MRILYITPMWNGLKDIVVDGKKESNGMPAFIHPLIEFKTRGIVVDIIIAYDEISMIPKNTENITLGDVFLYKFKPEKSSKNIKNPISFFIKILKHINERNYDFIYTHGSLGVLGVIAANLYSIPVGQRLYGTFMYSEIKNYGLLKSAIKHPLEYLSFVTKKDFLMVTNDGTKGDKVFELINKNRNKNNLLFFNNGVNRAKNTINLESHNNELFYPARVTRWKRQHLAVEMLAKLHDFGLKDLDLVFSGQIDDLEYKREVLLLAENLGIKENVRFLGALNKEQMEHNYRNSFAVLCMYEHSNLGNVFIEAYCLGALIISLDDDSLSGYIDENSGIVSNSMSVLLKRIILVYNNKKLRDDIRIHGSLRSKEIFLEWCDRVKLEVDIIKEYIKQE